MQDYNEGTNRIALKINIWHTSVKKVGFWVMYATDFRTSSHINIIVEDIRFFCVEDVLDN